MRRRSFRATAGLGVAFRNRNVRRLELAWAVAIAAEWAHFVALGVFAFRQGGASLVGLAGLVRLLPAGLVAPFAAGLGDRGRRERMLLVLMVVEAAALAGSGAAAIASGTAVVLALASVIGVTSTLVRPVVQSLLPSLVNTPDELIASNSATATLEGLGALLGPLVVGVSFVFASVGAVFLATAVVALAGSLVLLGVRSVGLIRLAEPTGGPGALRASAGGYRLVLREPRLRLLIGLAGAQCFARGCLNVLLVVGAFRLFHGGSSGVGYLNASIGVGGLVGAIGATRLSRRRLGLTFGTAIFFWGAPIALLAPLAELGPAMACVAVVGLANAVEDVSLITLLQRSAPDHMLSRVLGVLWGVAMLSVAAGSAVAPALVDALGPRPSLLAVGGALAVLPVIFSRHLERVDGAGAPAEGYLLIDGVPMFAPLPLATKERLAALLVPVRAQAGEVVVRAGEAGDQFYVVGSGRLGVERAGVLVATAEKGGFFGEIALIDGVPRTASVTAEVDSDLYSLHRDAFLAAVTGHPVAVAKARTVAAERRPEGRSG